MTTMFMSAPAFASDPAMPMWMSDREWQNPPFSRQCYRPSELMGAIARVQLSKIGDILSHTRLLKKVFLAETGCPQWVYPAVR